ncbi:DUF523 domain-containing protein [Sporohalobacter salinus]|uniref:DUF523 domain-containing protein n=1 Tax=Sporohalobacter salinus TaxID=1494606 RepID=UPI00195F2E6B|nr:DUF523 domain-containing protein [Sporohalobacter salinus]MBM7622566.1 uncharacterized protein YbbK (DUF523 family) [Sporohalobacter salinus]
MLAVSSCLLGCDCKYNGGNNEDERIIKLSEVKPVIPICPEKLGQLPIPRPPAEIRNGDGADVLDGKARVVNKQGKDVTNEFIEGAYQALQQIRMNGITTAVLKSRSPSCGKGRIYTGDFSGELKDGHGVTTALFKRNGIQVYTEEDIEKLL